MIRSSNIRLLLTYIPKISFLKILQNNLSVRVDPVFQSVRVDPVFPTVRVNLFFMFTHIISTSKRFNILIITIIEISMFINAMHKVVRFAILHSSIKREKLFHSLARIFNYLLNLICAENRVPRNR